jgi:hypothetical protein
MKRSPKSFRAKCSFIKSIPVVDGLHGEDDDEGGGGKDGEQRDHARHLVGVVAAGGADGGQFYRVLKFKKATYYLNPGVDHNFRRVFPIFGEKIGVFFSKNNVMIKMKKNAIFTPNFLAKTFLR